MAPGYRQVRSDFPSVCEPEMLAVQDDDTIGRSRSLNWSVMGEEPGFQLARTAEDRLAKDPAGSKSTQLALELFLRDLSQGTLQLRFGLFLDWYIPQG